jgi:zinc D-Ala-D-Ala carboxypeptidase
MSKIISIVISILFVSIILIGCNVNNKPANTTENNQIAETETDKTSNKTEKPANEAEPKPETQQPTQNGNNAITVIAKPEAIAVLVNKQNKLPDGYAPNDLVDVNVAYATSATAEKRKLRQEAATALENMFAGANQQGISLLGVSGYRSHATQTYLFNYYVEKDGYENAITYSAVPGTSEHETGLSIDVTGGDGKCAVQDCFGDTNEAKWLQEHGSEYGYIIRYPKGKEGITGYKYEPWHIRYVGAAIAKEIMSKGITLEEYYNAIPVNN